MHHPDPLHSQMIDPVREESLRRVEQRLLTSLDNRTMAGPLYAWMRRRWPLAAVTAAAAVICIAVLTVPSGPDVANGKTATSVANGPAPAGLDTPDTPAESSPRAEFAEGVQIEERRPSSIVMAPHALRMDGGHVVIRVPEGDQDWTIETAHLTVQTRGSRIEIERLASSSRVRVEAGWAEIRTKVGGSHRLVAGESFVAERPAEAIVEKIGRPAQRITSDTEPNDAELADQAEDTSDQVTFAEVDRARAEGRIADAVMILRDLAQSGPADQRALALFTLGKLEHQRGHIQAAERALLGAQRIVASGPIRNAIDQRLSEIRAAFQPAQ